MDQGGLVLIRGILLYFRDAPVEKLFHLLVCNRCNFWNFIGQFASLLSYQINWKFSCKCFQWQKLSQQ